MLAIYTSFEAQSASIASSVFGPTGFPFPKGRHFQDDSLLVNSVKLCVNIPSMLNMVEQKKCPCIYLLLANKSTSQSISTETNGLHHRVLPFKTVVWPGLSLWFSVFKVELHHFTAGKPVDQSVRAQCSDALVNLRPLGVIIHFK